MAYDPTGIIGAAEVSDVGGAPDKDTAHKLSQMRSRFKMAVAAYSDTREDQLDDLRFMAGSSDNHYQWPADVLSVRGSVQGQTINARPCLTINKLPQHVRQVTNEQRQNRPSPNVIPVDDDADIEVAEIFDGMIRHIEYISDADVAYDTACDNQVTYGEGYIRILTEYCDETSFDQDIKNDFSADVRYGMLAGLNPAQGLIFMLQALGGKLISKDMAMRELPFTVNVSQEVEKIEIEDMRQALLVSLQQYTQAIPQIAATGGDPSQIVSKIAQVIKARQKGRAIEDAIEEIFTPEPQVPPAGAAPSMVEQPSPAPTGAPVGGALPMEAGAGAPPDIMSLLSSLTGSGEANASVRTIRRR